MAREWLLIMQWSCWMLMMTMTICEEDHPLPIETPSLYVIFLERSSPWSVWYNLFIALFTILFFLRVKQLNTYCFSPFSCPSISVLTTHALTAHSFSTLECIGGILQFEGSS